MVFASGFYAAKITVLTENYETVRLGVVENFGVRCALVKCVFRPDDIEPLGTNRSHEAVRNVFVRQYPHADFSDFSDRSGPSGL